MMKTIFSAICLAVCCTLLAGDVSAQCPDCPTARVSNGSPGTAKVFRMQENFVSGWQPRYETQTVVAGFDPVIESRTVEYELRPVRAWRGAEVGIPGVLGVRDGLADPIDFEMDTGRRVIHIQEDETGADRITIKERGILKGVLRCLARKFIENRIDRPEPGLPIGQGRNRSFRRAF